MVNDVLFSEWLNEQMRQRNWSQADLALAAGIGPSAVSKLLTSESKRPDPVSILGIAKAFDIAPEKVYRAAKLLPTYPEIPELEDLVMFLSQLSTHERQEIVMIAQAKVQFNKKGYAIVI